MCCGCVLAPPCCRASCFLGFAQLLSRRVVRGAHTITPTVRPPRRNRNGYLDASEIGELFEDLEQTEDKNKFLMIQLVSMRSRANAEPAA